MIELNDHGYFVLAVDHGGFASAARATGIPKSTLSRRVSELESRLGVRLIERSSRRFVTTETGRAFYEHAKAMLVEAEAAEQVVVQRLSEPSGTVRITCSIGMAAALSPLLVRFIGLHPKVDLVQLATNRSVDVVEEGIDVAVRGHRGALPDSALIQRKLADTPWHAFAAPSYCEDTGSPNLPTEVGALPTLAIGTGDSAATWEFSRGEERTLVTIHPRFRSSDMETLKNAAIAGLGIVSLPAYVAADAVAQGSLVRVLGDWVTQEAQITLLTPPHRSQLPSVRALLDFLVDEYPRIVDRPPA